MRRVPVHASRPDPTTMGQAAHIIRSGGLVAFPTETVYGLGANALDETAVGRVFLAKGRPAHNPLIAHVADAEGALRLVTDWPESAERLARAFWPGPLTLVLPRGQAVPDIVTAGLPQVAVRVPAHPVALALIQSAGLPVVAPSANPSMAVSPTTAEHVERSLGSRVDMILDGGPTRLGIESTVIDLSTRPPLLLRPGALAAQEIERLIGPLGTPSRGGGLPAHASPGMLERHYAPSATLVLFRPENRLQAEAMAERAAAEGRCVGAILLRPMETAVHCAILMPGDARAYARRLYAELHRLDELGCDMILAEQVPEEPGWEGVRDRLSRAAAPAAPLE